jgi:hypothetical protein
MTFLLELVPVVLVVGVVWLVFQRSQLSRLERTELANLRVFKESVRDAALNEVEIDASSSLGRIVLDEVRQVDRANSARKDLP